MSGRGKLEPYDRRGARHSAQGDHPPFFSPVSGRQWGLPNAKAWMGEHERKLKKYKELGWLRTEICAELWAFFPTKGDIVPMAGSCMQVANNTCLGRRWMGWVP